MKFDLKEFKKIKEDNASAILEHPKNKPSIRIAKEMLSPKMREQLATMPIHLKDGGDESGNPFADWYDKAKQSVADLFPETPPPEQPSEPVDPETVAKQNLYNQYITGTFGPDAAIAAQNMRGAGTLAENGKWPEKINPEIATAVNKDYEMNKIKMAENEERQAFQNKLDVFEQAKKENEVRRLMGQQELPLPEDPFSKPDYFKRANYQPENQMQQFQEQPQQAQPQNQKGSDPMAEYMSGYKQQMSGYDKEAAAMDALGQEKALRAQEQVSALQNIQKDFQKNYDSLNEQRMALMEDYKNGAIKPNHYLENMSTEGKIMSSLGILLSGLGTGGTGQSNLAMDIINKQIDRDIDSQVKNLNAKHNLLSANQEMFGNLKDATAMTRVMMNDLYAAKIDEAAAKASGPIAKAKAMQIKAELQQKNAQLMQELSLKSALMNGVSGGSPLVNSPEGAVRMAQLVPKEDRNEYMKELKQASEDIKKRDIALEAFDKVAKVKSGKGLASHPIDYLSSAEGDAMDSVILELAKDSTGKVNEAVVKSYANQFKPGLKDDEKDILVKRNSFKKALESKQNYPTLWAYKVDPSMWGRYSGPSGDKFNLGPPKQQPARQQNYQTVKYKK